MEPTGVNRSYNNALVLLRFGGIMCIALGSLGVTYIAAYVVLWANHAPEWLMGWTAPDVANAIIGSPLYILLGSIILALSRRLARFVAKHSQPEA
jgi:hypothetical protein